MKSLGYNNVRQIIFKENLKMFKVHERLRFREKYSEKSLITDAADEIDGFEDQYGFM